MAVNKSPKYVLRAKHLENRGSLGISCRLDPLTTAGAEIDAETPPFSTTGEVRAMTMKSQENSSDKKLTFTRRPLDRLPGALCDADYLAGAIGCDFEMFRM
jgi:hypothetical protein